MVLWEGKPAVFRIAEPRVLRMPQTAKAPCCSLEGLGRRIFGDARVFAVGGTDTQVGRLSAYGERHEPADCTMADPIRSAAAEQEHTEQEEAVL